MPDTLPTAYSFHHFLFPFRWDFLNEKFVATDRKESIPFDERTQLIKFHELIAPDNSPHWKRLPFSLEENGNLNHVSYNEFTYFYDFVRKVIYDFDQGYYTAGTSSGNNGQNKSIGQLNFYEYKLAGTENFYLINYLGDNGVQPTLRLRITGISLHVFDTGVGILSFNLRNEEHKSKEEVRLINEFGRRIYPQFIRPEFAPVDDPNSTERKETGPISLKRTKEVFLANWIKLALADRTQPIEEPFENYPATVRNPFLPPAFIKELFPDQFCFSIDETLKQDKILLSRVLDDRMFFISWIGDDQLAGSISQEYGNGDFWYGYLFGDKRGKSIANGHMQASQISEHTYARWADYGTLFGISRDSFVSISATEKTLLANGAPPLGEQINSIYYNMVVLGLVQRATVLKFSAEVAYLGDITGGGDHKKVMAGVKDLYKNYIEFVNKIYFREVTSQIQGIELYQQMQKVMDINAHVEHLNKEIGELFNYVRLESEDIRAKESRRLTRIATVFLPASLITGIIGMPLWKEENFPTVHWSGHSFAWSQAVWSTIIVVIPTVIIYLSIHLLILRNNKRS